MKVDIFIKEYCKKKSNFCYSQPEKSDEKPNGEKLNVYDEYILMIKNIDLTKM